MPGLTRQSIEPNDSFGWMPGWMDARVKPGMTIENVAAAQASPSVSNIAALMASAALFPAQTTNWNAG
jgi:hypothetical protein